MELYEKYKILKPLGKQKVRKFGDVFLVQNKLDSKLAVLKTVNRLKVSSLVWEQLKNEATFSFENSSLPQVLEVNETENEFLLITEFKPGIPLDEFWTMLRKKQRMAFLVTFIRKFDLLYNDLRNKNIVHCDIKPGNILISGTAESFEIYLLDFGLALRTDQISERKLVFPLGFAAPELLLNELEIIDERTDIFALGIVIWRLYSEKLPLTHPNPSIFTNLQLTHPLPENTSISKKLYPVLLKMCWKHQFGIPPNKLESEERRKLLREGMNGRYSTLSEILVDLEKIKGQKSRWWPFTT